MFILNLEQKQKNIILRPNLNGPPLSVFSPQLRTSPKAKISVESNGSDYSIHNDPVTSSPISNTSPKLELPEVFLDSEENLNQRSNYVGKLLTPIRVVI